MHKKLPQNRKNYTAGTVQTNDSSLYKLTAGAVPLNKNEQDNQILWYPVRQYKSSKEIEHNYLKQRKQGMSDWEMLYQTMLVWMPKKSKMKYRPGGRFLQGGKTNVERLDLCP